MGRKIWFVIFSRNKILSKIFEQIRNIFLGALNIYSVVLSLFLGTLWLHYKGSEEEAQNSNWFLKKENRKIIYYLNCRNFRNLNIRESFRKVQFAKVYTREKNLKKFKLQLLFLFEFKKTKKCYNKNGIIYLYTYPYIFTCFIFYFDNLL